MGESEEIKIKSTSANSADCSEIILRKKETARLVFKPTLVDNTNNKKSCVKGTFVWQRKKKSDKWPNLEDEWLDVETEKLSGLKVGEGYKLVLHSGALLVNLFLTGPPQVKATVKTGVKSGSSGKKSRK